MLLIAKDAQRIETYVERRAWNGPGAQSVYDGVQHRKSEEDR